MKRELLKRRKEELGYTNQMIADLSGVPLGTVQKFFAGTTESPRMNTVMAIEKVLFPAERPAQGTSPAAGSEGQDMVRETNVLWKAGRKVDEPLSEKNVTGRVGPYTYSDYIALPPDQRVELIEGNFFKMDAPSVRHQIMLSQLHLQFQACAAAHPECLVLFSPLDVLLDEDDRTCLQPDLVVVCDRSRVRSRFIFGAPDLVIEVLSAWSRTRDCSLKMAKYVAAGVREYWIIDIKNGKVVVYDIEHEMQISIHSMDEEIPVAISGGQCKIDMKAISQYLEGIPQE